MIMSDPKQEFHAPPAPVIEDQKVVRATKLLPYAIGLFVVGVIVCVAGIIKLIPGGIGTGAAFAFWGILLFAYSFIQLPQSKGDEEPPMSGLQKLTGMFYQPSRVFRNLRAHPRWLAAFITVAIANAAYAAVVEQRLTTERISEFLKQKLDQSP